jgi:hypothetical protein
MLIKNSEKGVKLFWDMAIEAREARAQMPCLILALVKAKPSKNILLAKAKPSKSEMVIYPHEALKLIRKYFPS